MYKFVFLLKSYKLDYSYVERLIKSYDLHNKELIPMYIVVPEDDIFIFNKFENSNIFIISEQSVTPLLVTDFSVHGIRPGYINQEIIKLAFWELNYCENYFCIDSDGVFLRDFFYKDFMYDEDTPYTILVEDNELKVEPEYYSTFWTTREGVINKIQKAIGLKDSILLTSHGFSILSRKVMLSFQNNYLKPRNLNYVDILKIAPYEFSWYNLWLQHDKTIDIHIREPLFKCFHHKNQHLEYLLRNIKSSDISNGYIGVIVNSNYSRDFGLINYDDNRLKIISVYLSMKELIQIISFKIWAILASYPNRLKMKWNKYVH